MKPIVIIDYGMGNIGSLRNMFRRVGADISVAADAGSIERAGKLLLPGVGAFDAAMECINNLDLADAIRGRADAGVPILGICLGMQLLTDGSEEGNLPGLGIIPARAHRFPRIAGLKVPHMGWNVVQKSTPSELTAQLDPGSRFYFVHSYHVQVNDPRHSILTAEYGVRFDAAIQKENVFGAQFHPEKSHKYGMALLRSFAQMPC
ncbi:imidazole glycerol phosphate synthase subunit HisH [Altererythrobacter sp. Root672]|uniref:imidazole glycerol phosphate synthase subunit HisH n=1 Tax=Altererythrobacter sp. Root672 TaxID=1736584 RepID=UPI0006FCBA63|nr:imidazole glycerol phosphate synthase subunit HisH [Altererythrobacter sp. Root672]KRA83196.1 imidazole glycerol phosphate synthase subunit HisH [Altererythrobacter sp. Root672]